MKWASTLHSVKNHSRNFVGLMEGDYIVLNEEVLLMMEDKLRQNPQMLEYFTGDSIKALILSGDQNEAIDFGRIFSFVVELTMLNEFCLSRMFLNLNLNVDIKLCNIQFPVDITPSKLYFYGSFCF